MTIKEKAEYLKEHYSVRPSSELLDRYINDVQKYCSKHKIDFWWEKTFRGRIDIILSYNNKKELLKEILK